MKSKKSPQPPVAERTAGGPKGRAPVAGTGEKRGTIASQTKTTRKLDQAVKREADSRMAGKQKALERWEGEGGAIPPTKKGGKQ